MKRLFSAMLSLMLLFSASGVRAEAAGDCKASILVEQETGEVLQEENADEELPIASVTKIMTMLLIMEEIDSGRMTPADEVTVSDYAMSMGGSTMFLESGEVLSVSDMLKGIAVASANDGCVAMAEHISGSTDAFVERMNQRAKELGMLHTHFMNTNGLDADGHYSSARDVAIMACELSKHEKIFEYTSIWTDSLRDGKFLLANTNKMVRFYRGATGLKTGSTDKAGCCLCASATRDGMSLISVVLGAPTSKQRFASSSALLDYGFANYSVVRPVSKGEQMGEIKVRKGAAETVAAVAADNYVKVVPKGSSKNVEVNLILPEQIAAPATKGEVIGKAEFLIDSQKIGSVELVIENDVEKKGFFVMLSDIFKGIVGL